jgi:hypothetical protein
LRSSVFFASKRQPTMHPPQRTHASKSTATTVRRNVSSTPRRRATSRTTVSAADSPVGDVRPLRVLEERIERLVQRVRVDERASADACTRQDDEVVEQRHPLNPAQAEPRHEQIAAEVPVRPGEVLRAEPASGLEHPDAISLLREAERGNAAAESAPDNEHIEVVHLHPG